MQTVLVKISQIKQTKINNKYLFYYSLNIQLIQYHDFYEKFETQSLNASAKLCLCVDELFQNELELRRSRNYFWNQLTEPLYTSHEAVGMYQNSFAFRMFKKTVDRLIDTGVMSHLSNKHYTRKHTYYRVLDGPKVLSLDDVSFGFNIWFGFCLFSFLIFVIENLTKIIKTNEKDQKKYKYAKVYPMTATEYETNYQLKVSTLRIFRVERK